MRLSGEGLYIVHLSIHGRIRAHNPELGIDADTGGQTKYVLDLMRQLDGLRGVDRIDLLTRRFGSLELTDAYSMPEEKLGRNSKIIRLNCGPTGYLPKEELWPHLLEFADAAIAYLRMQPRIPDLLHGHYADGGLVASRISKALGIPFIFTAHSLGRYKHQTLLDAGCDASDIAERFRFKQRIEAEEEALENAARVIASTSHEVNTQYAAYDHFAPETMEVIPPGCELVGMSIHPTRDNLRQLDDLLSPFLRFPRRAPIIAIARPDRRKNIEGLIHAFGQSGLRDMANLILLVGSRDDLSHKSEDEAALFADIFKLIDQYNLYGSVAYPKQHQREDVEALLHFTRFHKGVLVNLSSQENFGLTLVEAATVGVPVVSSGAGGMTDVVRACKHGLLAKGDDPQEVAEMISRLLRYKHLWRRLSRLGRERSLAIYSWAAFADSYVSVANRVVEAAQMEPSKHKAVVRPEKKPQRVFLCDIDDTLLGDNSALRRISDVLRRHPEIAFGVATGRSLTGAREILANTGLPEPVIYVTSVGSRIHYNFDGLVEDRNWIRHIRFAWQPHTISMLARKLPWLEPQEESAQAPEKLSYYVKGNRFDPVADVKSILRRNRIKARVSLARNACLDILPTRCSKGHALRYLCWNLGLDASQFITAGDSGNDIDMLTGAPSGIVVANHMAELDVLRGQSSIYFSSQRAGLGVLEGLRHFGIS